MTLASLVSPYVGVVRRLDEILAATADPQLPAYSCETVDDPRLLGSPLDAIGGVCGIGLDRRSGAGAALGETAERYSLCFLPQRRLVRRRARNLEAAVRPERFGLFSRKQHAQPGFPFTPFTGDTEVPWVDGWNIPSGEHAWLPAELVFLADAVGAEGRRIGYATSSGAACAASTELAVLKGLFELLERDAFMITWACRLSLPLVDWRRHDRLADIDRRYFRRTGLRYATVDLSCFHGVPSLLAVVRAPRSEAAAVGVGAGTAATIEEAWWKALSEAFACRAAAARLRLIGRGRGFQSDGSNVQSFEDHILFYAGHERAERTAFLDASSDRVDARDIQAVPGALPQRLDAIVDRVERAGLAAYAVEVTAPDIAQLGVHVVKTVAPGLCMLDVPHGARFLGNPRLCGAAAALGLVPRPVAESQLNADPHPFP